MADYAIAADAVAVHDKTLGADADTVTFARPIERVEIITDGSAAVCVAVGGTVATVSGANTYVIPAQLGGVPGSKVITISGTVLSIISAGTPTYSVQRA